MDKKYIDDFFGFIPKVEMTEEERAKVQAKERLEDIKYYTNRNEKGYCIR